jgi:hypothetical protein
LSHYVRSHCHAWDAADTHEQSWEKATTGRPTWYTYGSRTDGWGVSNRSLAAAAAAAAAAAIRTYLVSSVRMVLCFVLHLKGFVSLTDGHKAECSRFLKATDR